MSYLLQRFRPVLILSIALVLSLHASTSLAQITVSVDDIDPWYGRTLTVISSQTDSLSDESVVHPILDAVGENATYDFRGITFAETFRGTMRYLRMTPDGPGGDVDHLLPSTTVMELSTELEEDVVQMIMWGFSEVRDDSVFQRGAILRYDLLVEMEGVESTADTMLFDPPTFSDPASYTYGDSWTAPSVLGSAFGDTEVEVVGYGTLITPRGQERQALRIERTTGTFGLEMKTIEFVTGAGDGPPGVAASINVTVIGDELIVGGIDFTEITGEAGTSAAHRTGPPEALRLGANYPNPFSEMTTIPFELSEGGDVTLRIFDLLGREVAVAVNAVLPAGRHEASFDSSGLPSGTYVYRIKAAGASRSGVMTVAR